MCGIIGYKGDENSIPILVDSLKRLEYRGYDSAGISYIDKDSYIKTIKHSGSVGDLKIPKRAKGGTGIGHTRWATHGSACKRNAHPHVSFDNTLAIVHNGIIENYKEIKKSLKDKYNIVSDTDSEILLYLIYDSMRMVGNVYDAVKVSVEKLIGAYSFIILDQRNPNSLICAKKGGALCIGVEGSNYFVASDPGAFNEYTNSIIKLKNGYITKIEDDNIEHYDSSVRDLVQCNITKIYNNTYEISQEHYSSFMEKEINEQPKCIDNCLLGRIDGYNVKLGGFEDRRYIFNRARRITLLGCGSSWHAGLLGKYFIEEISGLPVNVEYASEFRYRNPVIENGDIVIGISQSGETADTIAAMEMSKKKGAIVAGICNTEGSSMSEISECGIYTRCGVEVGVASTKTFTNQSLCLLLLSLWIEQTTRYSDLRKRNKIVDGLRELPILCAEALKCNKKIKSISNTYAHSRNCLFLGRRYNYPVALEGALKLKEISYIHAEGYPAAEMKHGPIALIDENMPVIVIANDTEQYEKITNNKSEVEARGARVLMVSNQINEEETTDNDIYVPRCENILAPFMSIVPLQFFAMYMAMQLGKNVDRPRNLAKSVTVE